MKYLLDTNILIHWVRGGEKERALEQRFCLMSPSQELYISAVSKGEILSFAKQSNWGAPKMARLYQILERIAGIPIDGSSPLMEAYADIDAYSQGKHPEYLPPDGFSARNMGKNDLWIAATAFLLDVPLITADHDFDHLHPDFIQVEIA